MEYSLAVGLRIISCRDSNRAPFNCVYRWEQTKIARSHVGKVNSLSNHQNFVFGQETLNQLRGMSLCLVMMQLPISCSPQVRSLALHSITKTTDFHVVFFVMFWPCGAYSWCPTPQITNKSVNITLMVLRTCLASFVECFHCDDCALVSGSYP